MRVVVPKVVPKVGETGADVHVLGSTLLVSAWVFGSGSISKIVDKASGLLSKISRSGTLGSEVSDEVDMEVRLVSVDEVSEDVGDEAVQVTESLSPKLILVKDCIVNQEAVGRVL